MDYQRPAISRLKSRLDEKPLRVQILAGPRQVGKTTMVRQLLAGRPAAASRYVAVDEPTRRVTAGGKLLGDEVGVGTVRAWQGRDINAQWLTDEWSQASAEAVAWQQSNSRLAKTVPFVFVIDEIQKVPQWSEAVKGLWDRNADDRLPMHVLLLGSAPLLVQQGLSESLAGRYEVLRLGHWSFEEMNDAFGFTFDQYIYFGGFPGSAAFIHDETRWREYLLNSLIQPNIEKDILAMTRVDKPVLLKHLFELGCNYSGQIVSLDKVLGQLHDAGNVTTLARYLDLLAQAGLISGLQKFSQNQLRKRKSPPKFQVLNNALMSALGSHGFGAALSDRSHWGRLVESAVGAHLANTADGDTHIHYWRDGGLEVDFVLERRGKLTAIEVKSGRSALNQPGLAEFSRRHGDCRTLLVGAEALPVGEFLRYPAEHWVG